MWIRHRRRGATPQACASHCERSCTNIASVFNPGTCSILRSLESHLVSCLGPTMASSLGWACTSFAGRPCRSGCTGLRPSASRSMVVSVSAKTKPTKASEFRGLTNEEIDKEVFNCQRRLLDLRIAQKTRKAFAPHEFGWNERKIAQLLTIKRERQLAEGISRREALKLERKEKLALGFGNF
eukprot:jgi/Botrbrau1/5649/Bobra.55_1s0037.1